MYKLTKYVRCFRAYYIVSVCERTSACVFVFIAFYWSLRFAIYCDFVSMRSLDSTVFIYLDISIQLDSVHVTDYVIINVYWYANSDVRNDKIWNYSRHHVHMHLPPGYSVRILKQWFFKFFWKIILIRKIIHHNCKPTIKNQHLLLF